MVYPIPKEGESIPTITFALGLADAFDAMTSKRSYKRNNSYCIAIEQIFLSYEPMIPNYQVEKKGVQFHPHAIKAFFNSLEVLEHIESKYVEDSFNEKWEEINNTFQFFRETINEFEN